MTPEELRERVARLVTLHSKPDRTDFAVTDAVLRVVAEALVQQCPTRTPYSGKTPIVYEPKWRFGRPENSPLAPWLPK